MLAIEIAFDKGWHNFWLECDSKLVVEAFKSDRIVPWHLRNRWRNCLILSRHMIFFYSHIYREGNACADTLASFGLSVGDFVWWDFVPNFIWDDFNHNKIGLPQFRFK